MERGEVESVKWIPTQDMLADVLTKRGVKKENIIEAIASASC